MRKIVVNGFFVTLHSPSKECLKSVTVDFSMLSPTDFYRFIDELEALLSDIDTEYRARKYEGGSRSIYAVFTKAYKKKREVRFSPYPNRFGNILGTVRTKLYDYVNYYAIVIANIEAGMYRRNIYLMPRYNVDQFLYEVDKLNRTLDSLRKDIEEYHKTGYMNDITNLLEKYGVKYDVRQANIEDIIVNMMPIVLDPEIIKPYLSERAIQEVEKAKKKIVEEAIKDFSTKVEYMINEYIMKIKREKFNPGEAKKTLEEMKRNINSLGLISIDTVIDPLIELCDNPKKLELEGLETAKGKIRALLESL